MWTTPEKTSQKTVFTFMPINTHDLSPKDSHPVRESRDNHPIRHSSDREIR
jgi:hypothetical protein